MLKLVGLFLISFTLGPAASAETTDLPPNIEYKNEKVYLSQCQKTCARPIVLSRAEVQEMYIRLQPSVLDHARAALHFIAGTVTASVYGWMPMVVSSIPK